MLGWVGIPMDRLLTRHSYKALAAAILTYFVSQRIYQNAKKRRNKKKMQMKRDELTVRKKNLEDRFDETKL